MRILTALTYYRPHTSGLTIYAERLAKALVERGLRQAHFGQSAHHIDCQPAFQHHGGCRSLRFRIVEDQRQAAFGLAFGVNQRDVNPVISAIDFSHCVGGIKRVLPQHITKRRCRQGHPIDGFQFKVSQRNRGAVSHHQDRARIIIVNPHAAWAIKGNIAADLGPVRGILKEARLQRIQLGKPGISPGHGRRLQSRSRLAQRILVLQKGRTLISHAWGHLLCLLDRVDRNGLIGGRLLTRHQRGQDRGQEKRCGIHHGSKV